MVDDVFKLAGCCLDEKYLVQAAVARGGFGIVYRGRHLALHRPVAIKVLAPPKGHSQAVTERFFADFEQEARLVSRLEHPAVVKVLDFGRFLGPDRTAVPWMVMEWVEGETLTRTLLPRRGAGGRSPAECMELFGPVLEAVAEAHAQSIAHRDIKPSNLLVVDPGILRGAPLPSRRGQPPVRLLDFGIAKVMSPEESIGGGNTQTQNAVISFSPPYAAPEQIARTRTGPWTDVHALGLILTEILTDRSPYRDLRNEDLVQAVYSPVRPTPAAFGVDVGPWEPVLAKALAFRASERFQSASDLLSALESALKTVRPPPPLPRAPLLAFPAVSAPPVPTATEAATATYSTLHPSLLPAPPAQPTEALPPPRARRETTALAALALVALTALALAARGPTPRTAAPPAASPVALPAALPVALPVVERLAPAAPDAAVPQLRPRAVTPSPLHPSPARRNDPPARPPRVRPPHASAPDFVPPE